MEEASLIDFKTLELLTKAPSKKYLRKFMEYCFLLRNKIKIIEDLLKTPVANQFCQDFQIDEEKAHQVYFKKKPFLFLFLLISFVILNKKSSFILQSN